MISIPLARFPGGFRWDDGGPEWLNPAKRGTLRLGQEGNPAIGAAGLLAKRVAEKFKFRQDVFLAELDLGPVYCMFYGVKNNRRYEPLPRFPGVERDFSLFLDDGKSFAEVKQTIEALDIPEMTSIVAADCSAEKMYRRENIRFWCASRSKAVKQL